MGLAARRNGTQMSWERTDEPTQHGDEIDGAIPGQRAPSQHEPASQTATDSNSEEEQDDEPEWYPPPDAACM